MNTSTFPIKQGSHIGVADLPQPKVVVRLRVFGRAGDRAPDATCDDFTPGEPNGRCSTDGHYMCLECEHAELCEGCGNIEARCECPPEPVWSDAQEEP